MERFSPELTLVDELYSEDSWTFQDIFDDIQKMTDAARIISEAAGVLKALCTQPDLAAVFLHGPLINPVAPYGAPGFPAFSTEAAKIFLHGRVQEFTDDEHHFVVLYRRLLLELVSMKTPVIGVVERSLSQNPTMLLTHVDALQKKGVLSAADAKKISDTLLQYRLSDVASRPVRLILIDPSQSDSLERVSGLCGLFELLDFALQARMSSLLDESPCPGVDVSCLCERQAVAV